MSLNARFSCLSDYAPDALSVDPARTFIRGQLSPLHTRERLALPCGDFEAFRIEGVGWSQSDKYGVNVYNLFWISPEVRRYIAHETRQRFANGKPVKHDKRRYKRRNRIEIMFGRLKDWRRVATRYDRCPETFFSAIMLAATVLFWL